MANAAEIAAFQQDSRELMLGQELAGLGWTALHRECEERGLQERGSTEALAARVAHARLEEKQHADDDMLRQMSALVDDDDDDDDDGGGGGGGGAAAAAAACDGLDQLLAAVGDSDSENDCSTYG